MNIDEYLADVPDNIKKEYFRGREIYNAYMAGSRAENPFGLKEIIARYKPSESGKLNPFHFFVSLGRCAEIEGTLKLVQDYTPYCRTFHVEIIPPGYFLCETAKQLENWLESVYEFHDHYMYYAKYSSGMEEWNRQDENYSQATLTFEYDGDKFSVIFKCVQLMCIVPDLDFSPHFIYESELKYHKGKFYYVEGGASDSELDDAINQIAGHRNILISHYLILPNKPYTDNYSPINIINQ